MPAYAQELRAKNFEFSRSDPACCTTNNHGGRRRRTLPFPDHQVLLFRAVAYRRRESDSSCSSSDEASTSVVRHPPTPYYDIVICNFMPHCEDLTEGVVVEVLGTEQSHRYESIQKVEGVELPKDFAVDQLILGVKMGWAFEHGCLTLEIRPLEEEEGGGGGGGEASSLPFLLSFATEKQQARLRVACQRLFRWYVERSECMPITARYKAEHFLSEPGFFRVGIDDLTNLFEVGPLGVGLIRCWTLYMMAKHNKEPIGFLDPQLVCEDTIKYDASKVEEYVTKAMLHHQDKIHIVAPYNFQSHWILIVIVLERSTVVYLDSMNNSPESYRLVTELIDRSFARYISNKGEDTPRQTTLKHHHQFPCHKQPDSGINRCGYYVCHHMQEILGAAEIEDIKIPTGQLLTSELVYIQGQLADFLLSSVINKDGEFHDPNAN